MIWRDLNWLMESWRIIFSEPFPGCWFWVPSWATSSADQLDIVAFCIPVHNSTMFEWRPAFPHFQYEALQCQSWREIRNCCDWGRSFNAILHLSNSFSRIFFRCYSVLSSFSNSHAWCFVIISCRPRCSLCCLQHCWLAVRPLPDAEGEWDLCLSMLARGKEFFDLLHNSPGQRLKFCEMFAMCLLENTSTLICTELWSGVSGVSFRNPLWNVPVLVQGAEEGCFVPTSGNVLLNCFARCTHYKRSGKSTLMRVWDGYEDLSDLSDTDLVLFRFCLMTMSCHIGGE